MDSILATIQRPLSASSNFVVVIASGICILAIIIKLIYNIFKAHGERSRIEETNKQNPYRKTVRSFKSFFASILQDEIQYETAWQAFSKQILRHHTLCSLYPSQKSTGNAPESSLVKLLIKTSALLSTNVIIAIVYYPMKKACENNFSEESCDETTTVSILGSICTWNHKSSTCTSSTINEQMAFVVSVVFVVSAVISLTEKFIIFALSHAELAVKLRRMSWLYRCFLPQHNEWYPSRNRIAVFGKKVRVVPVAAASTGSRGGGIKELEEIERGSETSMEDTFAHTRATVKPQSERASSPSARCFESMWKRIYPFLCCSYSQSTVENQRTASLGEVLSAEEEDLEHFGDELISLEVQSRKATMLRAARHTIMKAQMDYVSAMQERKHLLQHNKEKYLWMEKDDLPVHRSNWWDGLWKRFRLRQLRLFDFGDPVTALELMHLTHLQHHDIIEHRLRRSRAIATRLRAALSRQMSDADRDVYLMRSYLVHALSGHKRVVAQAIMFEHDEIVANRPDRVIWQYFALVTVPLFFLVSIAVTFYAGLVISSPASYVWLICTVLSLLHEHVVVQPISIWLLHVWFPGSAKKDLLAMHWILQVRAQTILARRKGLLYSANALVQHFHPVCRAARLMPHLPTARLLLSLSDYDIPMRSVLHRPRRRHEYYHKAQVLNTGSPLVSDRCEAICINAYSFWRYSYNIARTCTMAVLRLTLHGLYVLPVWARELTVEVSCSVGVLGLIWLIYLANRSDPSGGITGAIVAIVAVVVLIGGYKAHRDMKREGIMLNKFNMQREKYNLRCNPATSTLSIPSQENDEHVSASIKQASEFEP